MSILPFGVSGILASGQKMDGMLYAGSFVCRNARMLSMLYLKTKKKKIREREKSE